MILQTKDFTPEELSKQAILDASHTISQALSTLMTFLDPEDSESMKGDLTSFRLGLGSYKVLIERKARSREALQR